MSWALPPIPASPLLCALTVPPAIHLLSLGWELSLLKVPSSQAFSCIDQNRDGIICKSDLRETYSQLGERSPSVPPS